jgi:hypothetical protein
MRPFLILAALASLSISCRADEAEDAYYAFANRLSAGEPLGRLNYSEGLLAGMRAYGWSYYVQQPFNFEQTWLGLALLGDPQARPLVVEHMSNDPTSNIVWTLANSGVPTLLPDLAPVLLRQEPWKDLNLGGDVGVYPASFNMATAFIRLVARSTYFSKKVNAWAKRFGEKPMIYDPVQANELRDLTREWWRENESKIRAGDYTAVKPGRDPTTTTEPPAPIHGSVATPPASSPSQSIPDVRSTPSTHAPPSGQSAWFGLAAIIVSIILLVAGLAFFVRRSAN